MTGWRSVPCRIVPGDPKRRPRDRDGARIVSTHRLAWERVNGPIPTGMDVCHHCDNLRCFEPAHLFLGTNSDNMIDARDKGRLVAPNGIVLDVGSAELIRKLFASGQSQQAIADHLGVSYYAVKSVLNGRTWNASAAASRGSGRGSEVVARDELLESVVISRAGGGSRTRDIQLGKQSADDDESAGATEIEPSSGEKGGDR